MMAVKAPIVKDLVLLGGGHSHVEVLRSFGMKPMPGVRVTLVTRDVHTPYSGMLPGYISGFYTYDDCHIDLARLSSWAQARLVHAEASGIDVQSRRITLKNRPSVAYDVLSVDIGITPDSNRVPGVKEHTVPVKPIDRFVSHLDQLLDRSATRDQPLRLVVVGGGAGGVEVALSIQHRLEAERVKAGHPESMKAQISLVCRGALLDSHTAYARRSFLSILKAKGVTLHEQSEVVRVEQGRLILKSSSSAASTTSATTPAYTVTAAATDIPDATAESSVSHQGSSSQGQQNGGGGASGTRGVIEFDECLWCTQAAPAAWLKETGLTTDSQGFLAIQETLQVEGVYPEVFAAGDVASCARHPRPKAGVYAVRQGPPLAANLRRYLAGEPLQPFVPQSTNLALITTGDKYCVATKGWLGFQGAYLWNCKDHIDRTFMRKYGDDLDAMRDKMMKAEAQKRPGGGTAPGDQYPAITAAGPEALTLLAESKMRCGGCGSKVGASVLSRVLARLPPSTTSDTSCVLAGLEHPDDAAILRPPAAGKLLVQTVDFFRSFWDDSYIFGQVAANHALGDIYAMGGQPTAALAIAVVPLMSDKLVEDELTALMTGAHQVLSAAGCALVGGHTGEGAELSLGFSVTGEVPEGRVLRKGGLAAGQALVLTKPLGTGVLMAAYMKGRTKGRYVMSALASMTQSSREASDILVAHGAQAATDVTGFGLVGHLVEMTLAAGVCAHIQWSALPWLVGAAEALEAGVTSSMHTQNAKASATITNFQQLAESQGQLWPILVDPQTAGGLLAGVPQDKAAECVAALRAAGYSQACVIGHVVAGSGASGGPQITIGL